MNRRISNAGFWHSRRETGMIQRVRGSLRRGWDGPDIPNVLIACSGGRDSVVLTHIIHDLMQVGVLTAEIIHVDHAIREDSSEAVKVVEALSASLGLPFHLVTLENSGAHHPGVGLEEALRRDRYDAFADTTARIGADVVAIAHHQRDQAETVLLHLVRGAGLRGVSGMREWSTIEVPWWKREQPTRSLRLWRPLLDEPINEIAQWHSEYRLPIAEDSTNDDRVFRRNAIRHDILPELESIAAGATASIARFADIAAEDDEYLDQLATDLLSSCDVGTVHRSLLVNTNVALQRRVVRQWILASDFDGELTANRIDAILKMARRNRSGARVEIGAGWRVEIGGGVLSIRR